MSQQLEVKDEQLVEMWAETLKVFEHMPPRLATGRSAEVGAPAVRRVRIPAVAPQASYADARTRTPGLSLLVVAVAVMVMGGAVTAGLPATFAAVVGGCLGVICLLLVAADFGWRRA